MKKKWTIFLAGTLVFMALAACAPTGEAGGSDSQNASEYSSLSADGSVGETSTSPAENDGPQTVALSHYDGATYKSGSELSTINEKLFRRNGFNTAIADPYVLYISDEKHADYGSYYLYGTYTDSKRLECYKSTDLTTWRYVDVIYKPDTTTGLGQATASLLWAPEVVYEDGYYYMFFSASEEGERVYLSYCARASDPSGPFEIISNAASEERNTEYTQKLGDQYSLFNNDELMKWGEATFGSAFRTPDGTGDTTNDHLMTIDLSPFVDPVSGKKYLYFKMQGVYRVGGKNRDVLAGVEMETWVRPKYDTLTVLTVAGYYDTACTEANAFEEDTTTNEGPFMTQRKGKYYLTLSVFGYTNGKYSVWQAVGDNPLEDFRKLTEEEGGLLLTADGGQAEAMFTAGHHSLLSVGEELYIVYHSFPATKTKRYVFVDEVAWVSVTDKDGNGLDVMHTNGPTLGVMPEFESVSEYENVASRANVSVTKIYGMSKTAWLTDGSFNTNKTATQAFVGKYVQECKFRADTTITLSFEEYTTLRAVMIYNSLDKGAAFEKIKKISMDCKLSDGTEFVAEIDGLQFDAAAYTSTTDETQFFTLGCALAEFKEISVKTVRIEIEKPTAAEYVAVSEIILLGKAGAPSAGTKLSDYTGTYIMK